MAAPKPPTNVELAAELLAKFPRTPKRTLARKLYDANKERFPKLESARCAIRYAAGALGKKHHPKRKVNIPKGVAGWKPECPPSSAEPWLPVQIDGPCRVLILSDLHFPYHSKEAIEAAVAYGRKLKPDALLINGDFQDFYRISRFQQDPKLRTLKEELTVGKNAIVWLRERFPKARIIYKLGNHDERWDHYLWNKCVELFDLDNLQLQNVLDFEKHGIERVDGKPVLLGKLPVLHGHEFGRSGIAAPVNPARGAFLRTNHTVLIGHLHRPSSHAESNMWHDETMTWSTGCLCDLQPEYAKINKWAYGFASVDVSSDGQFNVHNLRLSADYQVRTA